MLVLLCFYGKRLNSKLYLRPEPKAHIKQPKSWAIEATRKGLSDDICDNLLFLHAFLGCDTTSKPFGLGKGLSIALYKRNPTFRNCADVFNSEPGTVTREDIVTAGETAMLCLYNAKDHTGGINRLRKITFLEKVATNTAVINPQLLPPTQDACQFHSLRVYYQILEWKNITEGVNVEDYGWRSRNGVLEPRKSDRAPAPQKVLKVIRCGCKTGCKTAVCGCRKLGLECSVVCKICRGDCMNTQKPDITDI